MAYGDYDGPDKPNKGHEGGACNRQRCQAEPAIWFNHGSNSWYCEDCKRDIGEDPVNKRDWEANFQPKLGHPMFETRDMMNNRDQRVCRVCDGGPGNYNACSCGMRYYDDRPSMLSGCMDFSEYYNSLPEAR